MRRAAKRDANEAAIIKTARLCGWFLTKLDTPCDWLGWFRGNWRPIEIKTKAGRLTKAQREFFSECISRNAPVLVWRSETDVVEASK